MKKLTKALIAVAALLGTALQSDAVQEFLAKAIVPILAAHPKLSGAAVAVGTILALAHNPKSNQ